MSELPDRPDTEAGKAGRGGWWWQQVIASAVVLVISAWIAWISHTAEPADAFRFPRLIATVMLILAAIVHMRALFGNAGATSSSTAEQGGLAWPEVRRFLPGIAVAVIYMFWGANYGFYTATAVCFFVLTSIYDPAPNRALKTWFRRGTMTAAFVLVMYALFGLLLNVFTPREVLLS